MKVIDPRSSENAFADTIQRICHEAFQDAAVTARQEIIFLVLGGLLWWGVGAIACHFFRVSSYWALALAVFVSAMGWRDAKRAIWASYVENALKEVGSDFNKKIELTQEKIGEMSREVEILKYELDAEKARTRRAYMPVVPPEVTGEADSERAVEAAIRDIGASAEVRPSQTDVREDYFIIFEISGLSEIARAFGEGARARLIAQISEKIKSICGVRPGCTFQSVGASFAIILRQISESEARQTARELCQVIRNSSWVVEGQNVRVVVRAGVASYPGDAASAEELLRVIRRAQSDQTEL